MTAPEDFRCDECGAAPGAGCTYIWPSQTLRPHEIVVYRPAEAHRWDHVSVQWDGYSLYSEQVLRMERWIRVGGGEVQWSIDPKHEHYDGPLGKLYARVGMPTRKPHTARYRAVYDYELAAYQSAMQDYLREWLEEFGGIFALD